MELKKEYKTLLETVKKTEAQEGRPSRNEDIAGRLGYNRSYFSSLLGEKGVVTEDHINRIKAFFPYLSGNPTPQPPLSKDTDTKEQALFNLTVGNRSLASANESLARSYELLLKMLSSEKRDQPISAELERRLTDLWLVIAEIGAGKRWESNEAAMQELNRYVVYPQSKTSGVDR